MWKLYVFLLHIIFHISDVFAITFTIQLFCFWKIIIVNHRHYVLINP